MKFAAITMTTNEPLFLPIWIQHYGSRLGFENLFIIDDSPERNINQMYPDLNVMFRPNRHYDETERALYISLFHENLLSRYNAVIYADTDELLLPDPDLGVSLFDYMAHELHDNIAAVGLNVLHDHFREPRIDLSRPLFRQRRFVHFAPDYCKPLASRVALRWGTGFHWARVRKSTDRGPKAPVTKKIDSAFYLFHLRAMDMDEARRRISVLNEAKLSDRSISEGLGAQFMLDEQSYIEQFFPSGTIEEVESREFSVDDMLPSAIPPAGNSFWWKKYPFSEKLYRVPDRMHDAIELHSKGIEYENFRRRNLKPSAIGWGQQLFEKCFWAAVFEISGASRNSLCPCGSGRRYKHCHGSLAAN